MIKQALILLAGIGLIAWSPNCNPDMCTLQLAFFTITVVDPEGEPVDGVELEVVHVRSETVLDVTDPSNEVVGRYAIVTSGHVMSGPVRDGDELQVTGTLGDASFTETYVVRTDSGPCHPTGIEGSTEVELDAQLPLDDCGLCLAEGGTWQPEASSCTEDCDLQDISCFRDVCPGSCDDDCSNCFSQGECEARDCTWNVAAEAMWCTG